MNNETENGDKNFSDILEGLKLFGTADVFRKEIKKIQEKKNLKKSLTKNPIIEKITNRLAKDKNNLNEKPKERGKVQKLKNKNRFCNLNIYKSAMSNFNTEMSSELCISSQAPNLNIQEESKNNSEVQEKVHTEEGENNQDSVQANESSCMEEDSMFANNTSASKQNNYRKIKNIFSGSSQLDKMLRIQNIKIDQHDSCNIMDSSSFFQNSQSLIVHEDSVLNKSEADEYVDDDDPGFDLYECDREYYEDTSKKLSEQYGFPERAIQKSKFKDLVRNDKDKQEKRLSLPENAKFMDCNDSYYPILNNNVYYDCFNLKIIINREKIGFEPEKELKFKPNALIAGRYKFQKELGDAAFSTAIQCYDILEKKMVCIKIIKNNKDYFDQSVDEIKLLRYINANGDPEEKNFLKIYDYFYYKEHLMIVSELLKDNLYDFYKYINDNNLEYLTIPKIQKLTKQILVCLEFIHGLKIIHCDLKPENILMKSISEVTCKVIDFGSSCFIHDHLSTYIQSRSYRAPEVILGCKYDYKIDMWSLGCILAEIYTGNVLFQNDSIQSMLARIVGICGPIPDWMFEKGKLVNDFFTKEKLLYMEPNENNSSMNQSVHFNMGKSKKVHILVPKKSSLKKRLRTSDDNFYNFVKGLLEIDPNLRMSATEALNHPWIKTVKYNLS